MEVKNCAYVTYNTKNFEHKLFGGMYGLAMMMFISTRTASKKIDKITHDVSVYSVKNSLIPGDALRYVTIQCNNDDLIPGDTLRYPQ